jgi:hypothetical protein
LISVLRMRAKMNFFLSALSCGKSFFSLQALVVAALLMAPAPARAEQSGAGFSFIGSLFGASVKQSKGERVRARRRRRGLAPLFASFGSARKARKVAPAIISQRKNIRLQSAPMRRMRKKRRGGGVAQGLAGAGGFRTMCVRLCDGYYFPINYSSDQGDFRSDSERCQMACPSSEVKLFYYRNAGEKLEEMRSVDGEKYKQLKNAFLYRSRFVANCRCRPEPWTREARSRHDEFALEEKERSEARKLFSPNSSLSEEAAIAEIAGLRVILRNSPRRRMDLN